MIERYSIPVITEIWSLHNQYRLWFNLEWAYYCVIRPEHIFDIPFTNLFFWERHTKEILELEKETKHDLVAFLQFLNNREDLTKDFKQWMHYNLTSSDIKDTVFIKQIQDSWKVFAGSIQNLNDAIDKKIIEPFKDLESIGRTHGQHAEPIKFISRFLLIQQMLHDAKTTKFKFYYGKLKGPVGNGIDPIVEFKTLQKFGHMLPIKQASQIIPRDKIAHLVFQLGLAGTIIEKLAMDLRLLAQTEIGEVQEGFDEGQYGSSAMPHKKNPIALENVCGIARVLRSYIELTLQNIVTWHERDMSHSAVERIILPDAFHCAIFATRRMTKIINNLQINLDNINKNLTMVDHDSQQRMNEYIAKGGSRFNSYNKSKFEQHLEHASEIVKDWPEWKRNILGKNKDR